MSDDASFARLMADFGQGLGLTDLTPSAEGVCQFVVDGRHLVQVMDAGARGLVFLSCRLADHGIDAAQAERMARANFLQAGRGAILCVAPDGRPYLQAALDRAACRAEALTAALEALLDQAESWTRGNDARDVSPGRAPGGKDPALFLRSV